MNSNLNVQVFISLAQALYFTKKTAQNIMTPNQLRYFKTLVHRFQEKANEKGCCIAKAEVSDLMKFLALNEIKPSEEINDDEAQALIYLTEAMCINVGVELK